MKKESISTYIIALLVLSSLLALPTRLSAQSTQKLTDEEKVYISSVLVHFHKIGLFNKVNDSELYNFLKRKNIKKYVKSVASGLVL